MGRAREKGIRIILWTKYYELTDDEKAALRQRLDMPNVLTQMVLDEPEPLARRVSPERLLD